MFAFLNENVEIMITKLNWNNLLQPSSNVSCNRVCIDVLSALSRFNGRDAWQLTRVTEVTSDRIFSWIFEKRCEDAIYTYRQGSNKKSPFVL